MKLCQQKWASVGIATVWRGGDTMSAEEVRGFPGIAMLAQH